MFDPNEVQIDESEVQAELSMDPEAWIAEMLS